MALNTVDKDNAIKILAKTLYGKLIRNGFTSRDIVNFSKELLECMAHEMCRNTPQKVSKKRTSLDPGI